VSVDGDDFTILSIGRTVLEECLAGRRVEVLPCKLCPFRYAGFARNGNATYEYFGNGAQLGLLLFLGPDDTLAWVGCGSAGSRKALNSDIGQRRRKGSSRHTANKDLRLGHWRLIESLNSEGGGGGQSGLCCTNFTRCCMRSERRRDRVILTVVDQYERSISGMPVRRGRLNASRPEPRRGRLT
jgi:hypothetical protein